MRKSSTDRGASSRDSVKAPLGVTVMAFLIVVGTIVVLWLIDRTDERLILAVAAIVVGWVLTLTLAEPVRIISFNGMKLTVGGGKRREQ